MKSLLLLNTSANTGSTGRIAEQIGLLAQQSGFEARFAYGRQAVNSRLTPIKIGGEWDVKLHGVVSRLFDAHGFASGRATRDFIRHLEKWKPDIVNIHNIHGYYINIEILFNYLKEANIPVVWTFHDCWPFTGHCSYFDRVNCYKWETECHHCPNRKGYPESWFLDRSRQNFHKKKELFNSVNNVTIVTPSHWLADHVSRSFLNSYPVKVINNGVDLNRFHPVDNTAVLEKYDVENAPFLLGVASTWDRRKGLADFIALRSVLQAEIQIVLVGLSPEQAKSLPVGIIPIARTESVEELAALYSAASVFVNPTYVDNFPTTNIEALACGTPVVTYRTGGSPEAVDKDTGMVVEKGDVAALKEAIENMVNKGKPAYQNKCRERAVKLYNQEDRFQDYITLFREMMISS